MKEIDEPGVNFIYQSGVTQLLGFIVEKATGEKLSDYVSRKLWTPMHAEESALWSLDRKDYAGYLHRVRLARIYDACGYNYARHIFGE